MKTVYQCELCRAVHESEEAAEGCEARHLNVTQAVEQRFSPRAETPHEIVFLAPSGYTLTYRRVTPN